MSLGKILCLTAVLLFGGLGIAAFLKESKNDQQIISQAKVAPVEVSLEEEIVPLEEAKPVPPPLPPVKAVEETKSAIPQILEDPFPEVDRIDELFSTKGNKFPFVETITYKSRVSWLKGRPAWLSDYASHYETSRHFIARSLNGKPDYFKQDIAEGAKFNVLKKEVPLSFLLLVDASRCKLWFYGVNTTDGTKTLIKTYTVGLGRPDSTKPSGLLTPLGKYSLGNRIAIYKPGVMGNHRGKKVEMITVFGTRWIPFDKEIADTTAPAKGLGIHGVPWIKKADGTFKQDRESLAKYESDGCIRMASEDVEEIFAVIITKPAAVLIVPKVEQSESVR